MDVSEKGESNTNIHPALHRRGWSNITMIPRVIQIMLNIFPKAQPIDSLKMDWYLNYIHRPSKNGQYHVVLTHYTKHMLDAQK